MGLVYLLAIPAYLVGTFPSAQLVASRRGHDPTREGSGNPGASNVYRVAGRRAGVAVLLLDLAKGAVPAAIGLWAGGADDGRLVALVCGLAALAGHVAPATRRFRGGKGVATAGGMAVVLFPILAVPLALLFVAVAGLTRVAALGSLAMAAAFPVLVAMSGRPGVEILGCAVASALVVVRHHGNISRLLGGRELRFGRSSDSRVRSDGGSP